MRKKIESESSSSYSEYDSSDDSQSDVQNLFGDVTPEQAV